MAAEDVNVSVTDAYLDRFPDVVQRLKRAGLKVQQQMDAVGVVSGSIDPTRLSDLEAVEGEAVEGVGAVERSKRFQLPPPDSKIQ
jgi:hypothetical protein